MLYGYVEGPLTARIAGNVESVGSWILSRFADEDQEDAINDRGGVIGGALAQAVQSEFWNTWRSQPRYTQRKSYLIPTDEFRWALLQAAARLR